MIVEIKPYPKLVTVWCLLWSGKIVRPFSFEKELGNELFRNITAQFFVRQLEDIGLE